MQGSPSISSFIFSRRSCTMGFKRRAAALLLALLESRVSNCYKGERLTKANLHHEMLWKVGTRCPSEQEQIACGIQDASSKPVEYGMSSTPPRCPHPCHFPIHAEHNNLAEENRYKPAWAWTKACSDRVGPLFCDQEGTRAKWGRELPYHGLPGLGQDRPASHRRCCASQAP